MARIKTPKLIEYLLLVLCTLGALYQLGILYKEYSQTRTSQMELVEEPLTFPPAVSVCFPLVRLLPRSFIYGQLWQKAFSVSNEDVYS